MSVFDDVDIERLRRRRTVKWTLYGPDVLAAWVAEMDFDVAPAVRRAILDAVDREDFGYIEGDLSQLTTACTDFFKSELGWTVPPTRIFPVADVLTGISAALDVFVAPGRGVVVPTPAYPPFFEIVELTGREVVATPMIDDGTRATLDLDGIDAALGAGAGAVLLCSPHNPTGRVFTAEELDALAEIVDRHGARVVADEVHASLVYSGHSHIPYATVSESAATHTVTVTSASKAFNLAGLKCAQVVASNHADAARWRQLRVFEVAGPTPLGIAASVAAYGVGREWLHDLVAYLDDNRRRLGELLAAKLPDITYRLPEATFLAWLDCAALGFDDPARHFLDHAGVAVSDGPALRARMRATRSSEFRDIARPARADRRRDGGRRLMKTRSAPSPSLLHGRMRQFDDVDSTSADARYCTIGSSRSTCVRRLERRAFRRGHSRVSRHRRVHRLRARCLRHRPSPRSSRMSYGAFSSALVRDATSRPSDARSRCSAPAATFSRVAPRWTLRAMRTLVLRPTSSSIDTFIRSIRRAIVDPGPD